MDYFIGHSQALRIIREARRTPGLELVPCKETSVRGLPVGRRFTWGQFKVEGISSLSEFDELRCPCLLVPSNKDRLRARGVKSFELAGELPPGAFLELIGKEGSVTMPSAHRYFVASPALALLQSAAEMGRIAGERRMTEGEATIRLTALAMELCGTYSRDSDRPREGMCEFRRPIIARPAQMRAFLGQLENRDGLTLARAAASLAEGPSASPMETLHYLMLCLPGSLGGLGLPRALLNHRVDMRQMTKGIAHHIRMKPDLSWPDAGVAIEHLGWEWHDADEALMLDAHRIQDYQAAGWQAYPATFADSRSQAAYNCFARHVVDALDPHGASGLWDGMERLMHDGAFLERQARLLRLVRPPKPDGRSGEARPASRRT